MTKMNYIAIFEDTRQVAIYSCVDDLRSPAIYESKSDAYRTINAAERCFVKNIANGILTFIPPRIILMEILPIKN